ncbi:membrane protein insertase YidC [Spirochaetia bacterium]|nr:membrane protein insertase YidC [Spirochaetia bacterium]
MEKNTVLAVVLSIVVLVGFYFWQGSVNPPQAAAPAGQSTTAVSEAPPVQSVPVQELSAPRPGTSVSPNTTISPNATSGMADAIADPGPQTEQRVTINTELLSVVLSNAGGDMVSWKLKERKENFLEMVLSGNSEAHAFSVAFGGLNAQPLTSFFYVNRISDYTVEFYRDFIIPGNSANAAGNGGEPGRFRLTKRYDFKPREYMFELTITLDGGYSVQGFNFGGQSLNGGNIAYTLAFGPQIGPKFVKLDNRYDYRQYFTFTNGKRKQVKPSDTINTQPAWAAISGKYFSFIAIPLLAQYEISFSDKEEPGLAAASRLNIIRPAVNSPKVTDAYRFYLGPKTQEALNVYNNGNNSFGVRDMQLIEVANTRGILSPLEKALKWLLVLFHDHVVHNWGVAIILLTLFVKIIFFPLTKKGSEATLRMQALAPKIKELQEKFKGNPQKLNVEMAAFYKAEGYNPLSGCLPMLLQLPIFFAMYNLFNNHFDLRGAEFIPHWIPDLSLPEAIWNFPDGFRLPLLGWNALRLLPFIYVGSQLLYGKVTQTPDQQGNSQMKMMLYVMPLVFFFILYDVPSGLLIYWIFSNILTMVQQVTINKYIAGKRAAQVTEPVIAPKKKKK